MDRHENKDKKNFLRLPFLQDAQDGTENRSLCTTLRRCAIFFGYLLIFPVLLQLLRLPGFEYGNFWLNWAAAASARIIIAAFFILLFSRITHAAAIFFMFLLCLLTGTVNLLDIYLLINFGTVFNYDIWQLMTTAPAHETAGFFRLFFLRWSTLFILLIYPAAGVIIFGIKKNRNLYLSIVIFTAAALVILNCCGADIPGTAPDAPGKRLLSFVKQWQENRMMRELQIHSSPLQAVNHEKEAVYLLVIGESHSRRRSSVYGYSRNTMPEMKKLFQKKQLFRFDDAVTPHVMTHLALPQMLTLADSQNATPFYKLPNIPGIFRAAGFKVWYIYNQMPDDSKKLPFLAVAKQADQFLSLSNPVKQYDSAVCKKVEKLLNDPEPKKLIIIQLLGSHWEYSQTYPSAEARFAAVPPGANAAQKKHSAVINDYDNSLLHLDKVLASLIFTLEQSGKNAFLLYLPDHGEALYEEDDFVGHTDIFPTAATAEIPMLLWISNAYARRQDREKIKRALKRPFFSEDLPHLLMELGRIKSPVFKPERSIINPRYKKMPRRVSTRSIDYDTMKNRSIIPAQ